MDPLQICVLVFGLITLQVCHVFGRETCANYGSTYSYCDDGYYCCDNNTRCCSDSLSVGAIIGIIFGIIFMIVMCVFCAAVLMKKKNKPGQVIHTTNQQNFTVATVSAHQYQTGRANDFNAMYANYGNYGNFGPQGNQGSYPSQPAVPTQPPAYTESSAYPPPPAYSAT